MHYKSKEKEKTKECEYSYFRTFILDLSYRQRNVLDQFTIIKRTCPSQL